MGKVTITMTDEQLRLVNRALESYFRTRMGQFWDYADDVCMYGVDLSADNPCNDKLFDNYITRRNSLKSIMENVFQSLTFNTCKKSQDCMDIIDIWQTVRYWFWQQKPENERSDWSVDSTPPLCEGQYPLPTIERESP